MPGLRFPILVSSVALCLLGCPDDSRPAADAEEPVFPTASARIKVSGSTQTSASTVASVPAKAAARTLYYERAVTAADLESRTLRELSLMRNTIFARAGNHFRRPWLRKHFTAQRWYSALEEMDASKLTDFDRANAKQIGSFDASINKADLERRRDEVLARRRANMALAEDAVEISLLSQRLGTWLGEPRANVSPLEDSTQLDKLVKIASLSTLSRRDLRILRNTVYARRGRSFDSRVVRAYFQASTWYAPRRDFHDGLLTSVDHKNIKLIRSVEDSLGGPLHENPNYGKGGWFVMS